MTNSSFRLLHLRLIFAMGILATCTMIVFGYEEPLKLWLPCGKKMCNHFMEYCYAGGSCSPCNKAECDAGHSRCSLACVLLPKLTQTEQQLAEKEKELNNTRLIVKEYEQTILNQRNQLANKDKGLKDVTSKRDVYRHSLIGVSVYALLCTLVVIGVLCYMWRKITTKPTDGDSEQQPSGETGPLLPTAPPMPQTTMENEEVGGTKAANGIHRTNDSGLNSSAGSLQSVESSTPPNDNAGLSLQATFQNSVENSRFKSQMSPPACEEKHEMCVSGGTPQGRAEREMADTTAGRDQTDTENTDIV